MKKNKLVNTLGIEVSQGVFYEQPAGEARSQQNIFDYLIKLLLVFFGSVGMMNCLGSSYSILFDNIFVMTALAPVSLYFLIMFSVGRRGRHMMMAAGMFLILAAVYLNWASLTVSVCYVYSVIAESYNSYYGLGLYLFELEKAGPDVGSLAMLVFMMPVSFLLAYTAGRPSRIRYAVMAFLPYMVMIMASGHMPEALPMYLVLGSFLGLMIIEKTAFCGVFQPKVRTDHASQSGLRGLAVCSMILFFAISVYLGSGLFYPKVEEVLGPIRYTVYNSSFRELYDQIRGGYSVGGINGGRLGRGGKLKFNHSVHLIVSTNTDISQYTYLKGYVGDIYDGTGWNALPSSAYQSESFSALEGYTETDIMSLTYVLSLNAKDMLINRKRVLSDLSSARWFVRVPDVYVGDSNYLCYPYAGLVSHEDGDIVNLSYLTRRSDGELENVYDVYYCSTQSGWMGSRLSGLQNDIEWIQSYFRDNGAVPGNLSALMNAVALERSYRTFVYENDLAVPDRVSKLRDEYAGMTFDTLEEAVKFVQEEVARDAVYTLLPDRCPYGEDFIEYFMYGRKEGYCTYFASAAVMIFRCLGIPARFVQGYIIPPINADTELYIDDSYAHAWAEIYVNGYGWLPVEVTPGFGGIAGGFTPDMNQEQQMPSESGNASKEETPADTSAEQTSEEPSAEERTTEGREESKKPTVGEKTSGDTGDTTSSKSGSGHKPNGTGSGTRDSGAGDILEPSGTTLSAAAIRVIRNIVLALLLLALVFGFVYYHRRSRLSARHRRFNQKSSRNCCLAIYRELCRMSARYYVPVDDTAVPHDLSLCYPIEEEIWGEIQRIAEEAAFSTHEITDEKKKLMLSVYYKCCRHIDTKLRFVKKLVFRFWDGYR